AELENAGITARTRAVAWTELFEKLANRLLVAQPAKGETAIGHSIVLSKRDQRLDHTPQLFGLGHGRLNGFVLDQGGSHVAEHRNPVTAVAVQLSPTFTVTHFSFPSVLAQASTSAGRMISIAERGRRPVVQPHAERPTVRSQHFLDLAQRLLAQVRGLEPLDFGSLHQIPHVMNAFGLQAVGGADRELQIVDRTQEQRINLRLAGLRLSLVLAALQVDEYRQLVAQQAGSEANRLFRVDDAVGFDVHDQAVEV